MKNTNKKGFTLIELMVVVIIVAILAAVALPLMSGNRRKAMSSEALAGAGTVLTTIRMIRAENDGVATGVETGAASALAGVSATDLDGNYFDTEDYAIDAADTDNIIISATGSADSGIAGGKYEGQTDGIVVTLDEQGNNTFTFTEPT